MEFYCTVKETSTTANAVNDSSSRILKCQMSGLNEVKKKKRRKAKTLQLRQITLLFFFSSFATTLICKYKTTKKKTKTRNC